MISFLKKTVLSILLAMIILTPLYSAVIDQNKYQVFQSMDKAIFYADEPVVIKIYIKNNSLTKNSYKIYENDKGFSPDYITFQPKVFDMQGREEEIIVPHRVKNEKYSDLLKALNEQIVTLAPGETLIHSIDLKKIFNLRTGKKYRVKTLFYPDFKEKLLLFSDNINSFSIRSIVREMDNRGKLRINRGISPEETLFLALNAEKREDWNGVIKYIKLDEYLKSYPDFKKRYDRADRFSKEDIKRSFKNFLSQKRYDYLINFEILRSRTEIYNGEKAVVYVLVDRFSPVKNDRYICKYGLKKYKGYDNLWLITELEVSVKRTIKK